MMMMTTTNTLTFINRMILPAFPMSPYSSKATKTREMKKGRSEMKSMKFIGWKKNFILPGLQQSLARG